MMRSKRFPNLVIESGSWEVPFSDGVTDKLGRLERVGLVYCSAGVALSVRPA
jgi:hypothetical protein